MNNNDLYQEIAEIDPEHGIYIVFQPETRKIYVKKYLDVYNITVYKKLSDSDFAGIPKIEAFYEESDRLILIEQYISGDTLESYLESHSIDDAFVLHCISSLCEIINQFHSMDPSIIHRDIKPSNIMITPQGDFYLLDFNAAKLFSSEKASDTVLLGTHGYAAPEQYGFAPSSPQTDIYSLGIVLKELAKKSIDQTHRFDTVIEACTHLDPSDRYTSVRQLQSALTDHSASSENLPADFISSAIEKTQTRKRISILPGLASVYLPVRLLSLAGYAILLALCMTTNFQDTGNIGNWILRLLRWLGVLLLSILLALFILVLMIIVVGIPF